MDKSDLKAILRYAHQNKIANKPFLFVLKWYNITNSLAYNNQTMYF